MGTILDGKKLSEKIIEQIKLETVKLNRDITIRPGLAVILVGNNVASEVYVGAKKRISEECGFYSVIHRLDINSEEEQLLYLIRLLNKDSHIHGILVQMPLPPQINADTVLQTISPDKDVDGFHYINAGRLVTTSCKKGFVPCTPAGVMIMIRYLHGRDLSGLNAVVVGRSNIVGKPVANLLLTANATVTITHSRTSGLPGIVRGADILVSATGQAEIIKGNWIKPGATVIDVGISRITKKKATQKCSRLLGDVEYRTAVLVAGALTPVPGGVGPMTIAMLMANTLKATCLSVAAEPPACCYL